MSRRIRPSRSSLPATIQFRWPRAHPSSLRGETAIRLTSLGRTPDLAPSRPLRSHYRRRKRRGIIPYCFADRSGSDPAECFDATAPTGRVNARPADAPANNVSTDFIRRTDPDRSGLSRQFAPLRLATRGETGAADRGDPAGFDRQSADHAVAGQHARDRAGKRARPAPRRQLRSERQCASRGRSCRRLLPGLYLPASIPTRVPAN